MTTRGPTRRPLPWRVGDLLAVYGVNVAGAVVIFAAWWGASGTGKLHTQLAWTNVALGGLMLAGVGNTVWIMTGRRSVGERRRWLLPDELVGISAHDDAAAGGADRLPPGAELVSAPGMTRFHLVGCPLVVGKRARRASRLAHERAGRRPCGVCQT